MPIRRAPLTLVCVCLLAVSGWLATTHAGTPPASTARSVRVVFLNPTSQSPDEVFWQTCTYFMQAAARDFGMELQVRYAGRSAAEMYRQADEALAGLNKPDFIVLQNLKKTAPTIIRKATAQGVKVLLFNSGLSGEEAADMGRPREKYPFWIGQITPDDEAAGYDLAAVLVRAAQQAGQLDGGGRVQMLALGGAMADSSAIDRKTGLLRYVREHPNAVQLHREQPLPADWEEDKAKKTLIAAYPSYPGTAAIWSANDNMAIGAREALRSLGARTPGKDVFIGGIDWNPANLAAVKDGSLTASIGGHFMEGAWVMVLIYDYLHGKDFASSGTVMKSPLSIIDRTNVEKFERALGERNPHKIGQIDFTRFSMAMRPQHKGYAFSLAAVLGQLK